MAQSSDSTRNSADAEPTRPVTNADGVDLTQIRRLLAMTPTERMHALVEAANNLLHIRRNARRV